MLILPHSPHFPDDIIADIFKSGTNSNNLPWRISVAITQEVLMAAEALAEYFS